MAYKYYDQKVKRLEKLSKPMQEELLFDLISAFSLVKSAEDSALFVQDLLTKAEVRMLSKRLRIAKLLLRGEKYETIMKELHTGRTTIAKVAAWLAESGEGFKRVVKKLPEPEQVKEWWEKTDWEHLVERYPRYFWPLSLSEGVRKESVRKRKKRLKHVFEELSKKDLLRSRIQEEAADRYKDKIKKSRK